MEVTKALKPGNKGTAPLLRKHGDRLVCVRYRFDRARNKNLTAVERIVDERELLGGSIAIQKRQQFPGKAYSARRDGDYFDASSRCQYTTLSTLGCLTIESSFWTLKLF